MGCSHFWFTKSGRRVYASLKEVERCFGGEDGGDELG